jgi:hypothetical protein
MFGRNVRSANADACLDGMVVPRGVVGDLTCVPDIGDANWTAELTAWAPRVITTRAPGRVSLRLHIVCDMCMNG